MKSIVHIIDSLQTGGAEVLLTSTIRNLPNIDHYVIILEPKNAYPDICNTAKVYSLSHSGWSDVVHSSQRIRAIVCDVNPDIIHAHLFLASFLTRLALGANPKVVITLHTLYSKAIFQKLHLKLLEKYVFKSEHRLIAVSDVVLKDYRKTITKCRNGYVLYNFISDEFFKYRDASERINGTELKNWVAVGSLKAVKNYQGMISLFKKLYDAAVDKSGFVLDIYGEGSLREELQKEIDLLQIPVRLKGKVSNMHTILDQYDAYISTSLYEGYGIAPMEALARGVPLFISDIPVYREVYKEHAFYFNIHEESGEGFLKAVFSYQLMSMEKKHDRRIYGREYAYSIANSNAYIKKLLAIYNS